MNTKMAVLEHRTVTGQEHGCEKPVALLEDLIDGYSQPEKIVADMFLGTGTVLIACERLNRKCRAIEISPAYVAVAIQRWVDVTGGVPELLQ
jgi:DNA modification methylase